MTLCEGIELPGARYERGTSDCLRAHRSVMLAATQFDRCEVDAALVFGRAAAQCTIAQRRPISEDGVLNLTSATGRRVFDFFVVSRLSPEGSQIQVGHIYRNLIHAMSV